MQHGGILEAAHRIAARYLDGVATRHVGARASREELARALGGPLPESAGDPIAILESLAADADRGVIASAVRALGSNGIADIVRRNCALARRMAGRLSAEPGITILNEIALNQVLVRFRDDATTREVISRVQAEGTCWAGGSVWRGQQAMRISVSNWSTTEDDIDRSAEAMLKCFRQSG